MDLNKVLQSWKFGKILGFLTAVSEPASAWTLMEGLGIYEPRDYVTISASYNPSACASDFPIHVVVINNYNQDIEFIQFRLSAREADRSTAIYYTDLWPYEDDKIVAAGKQAGSCWKVPEGSLDDFCEPHRVLCYHPGPEKEAAWRTKTQQYPFEKMVWTAEINEVQFSE